MRAAVYHGPEDLRVEEVPEPRAGEGEVLLRVLGAGICGTDLRILHGNHRKYPEGTLRIPGHEVIGEIYEVGTAVEELRRGERYVVAPNVGCGRCRQCISGNNNRCPNYQAIGITIDGGFAEYVKLPAPFLSQGNLIPVSKTVDPAVGSLMEPFACVLRGQEPLGIRPGETVLVMGAGPIGALHVALARLKGAGKIIVSDPNPYRANQALRFGADHALSAGGDRLAELVHDESAGEGADVIIVAAPAHAAQEEALKLAAIGGRINFFGGLPKDRPAIQFDSNLVHYKELVITATTACSTHDCWRAAEIINSGKLDLSPFVTGRYDLTSVGEAFEKAGLGESLKIVLQPNPPAR